MIRLHWHRSCHSNEMTPLPGNSLIQNLTLKNPIEPCSTSGGLSSIKNLQQKHVRLAIVQLPIGSKVACYLLGDYAAQKIGGHVWYLNNNHSNFWICVFCIKHPNDSHRLIIPSYEFLYCFRYKTLISFQSSSILLIYWGSPILVKDTATAPGANYCGSVTVPPPPWEKAHHTGDYFPHSLQSVRGFINVP